MIGTASFVECDVCGIRAGYGDTETNAWVVALAGGFQRLDLSGDGGAGVSDRCRYHRVGAPDGWWITSSIGLGDPADGEPQVGSLADLAPYTPRDPKTKVVRAWLQNDEGRWDCWAWSPYAEARAAEAASRELVSRCE